MLPSITKAAHPIAAAVTVIVIAGQWCRRKARIGMPTYGFQIALANRFFDACHSLSRNINRSCGLKIEILRREWDCINVLDKFCLVRVVLYLGMVCDTV
jgi:hypothetical protein